MRRSAFARIFERELWNYDSVSTETLLRICRITRWIAIPCFWAAGVMAVCLLEITVFGQLHPDGATAIGNVTFILLIASGLIGLVLMLPAIIGMFIVSDVEPVLYKRRIRIPGKRSLDQMANESLLKVILFIALPLTVCEAIEEPSLINCFAVLLYATVALTAMMKRRVRKRTSSEARTAK